MPILLYSQEKNEKANDTIKAVVNASSVENNEKTKKSLGDESTRSVNDTTKIVVGAPENEIKKDTLNTEDGAMDIDENRGIFIMGDNGNIQFRILGSIRFSSLFDNKLLEDKSRFNAFDIPTGDDNFNVLNYYNSLMFTRLGFEVTRKTNIGNIFIRLETDFAGEADGQDSAYRIRHAYAQFNNWLIGQTWSLFSNIRAQATSVNRVGAPGSISLRTPQIRYSFKIPWKNLRASAALEYSLPDVRESDSIADNNINVQTVPNLTARISSNNKFGHLQLSGIAAPITGVDTLGNTSTFLGFGVSFSGYWQVPNKDKLLFQATYASAVTHFINMFRNKALDLVYNPEKEQFEAIGSWSGNAAYEHLWRDNLSSSISFGIADIINKNFDDPNSYDYSYSASLNIFWTIVPGARIGLEYMNGKRENVGDSNGRASRVWALFYYDF